MEYYSILKSLGMLAAVMGLGWLSRKRNILAAGDTSSLASFIYNFALPALFFVEVARVDFRAIGFLPMALSLLPIAVVIFLLLVLRLLKILDKERFILYALSIAFGSNAFFGVPFFESLFGQWGLDTAVVTGSFLSIFGIIVTISLFEYAVHSHKGAGFLLRIVRSPMVGAIILGLVFSLAKPYGSFVYELVLPLGRTAPGLAIFMLGMFTYDKFSLGIIKVALPLALLRVISLPVVTLALLFLFNGIHGKMGEFLLLQSGIPSAVSVAVFAERYQYKAGELTGMVILTSLMSFFLLGVLYFIAHMLF